MRACHELGGEQFAILLAFYLGFSVILYINERSLIDPPHNYKIWITFLYKSLSLRLRESLLPYPGFSEI